jgi:hypothetical protein
MPFTRALTAALVAASLTAGSAFAATVPADRYGFAHGCFTLATEDGQAVAPAAGPFRMQATRLGEYLLYGKNKDFLADSGDGVPAPAATPSPSAEWIVRGSRASGFSITNKATGLLERVSFAEADGCAVYPEISPGATGTPKGNGNGAPAFGFVDGHMHWMGFELFGGDWHCGRPWHPYGAPYALPDCAANDVGTNGVVRAIEDGRTPGEPYDTAGWPTFGFWPAANHLADEATYYTSVERAWMAGLRILVVLYVDNEAMCDVMTKTHLPCHDMNAVRVQNRDLEELQDYIDAQSGGPGKGFLRIVESPAEARRVVADGKLAVVKGIELSRVLDCGEFNGTPECDQQDVDNGLRELWDMGVRDFFPVHKFDNGFGGTKGDGGETGYVVNLGNFSKTKHFWDMRHCDTPEHDQEQMAAPGAGDALDLIYNALGTMSPAAARVPIYGPGPHCNTRGLTDIGAYLINRMVDEHFIVETDHMDELTADATLDILEARDYAGVINSHGGWSSNRTIERIHALGGVSTLGSDINGLATQPGRPSTDRMISYPFTSRDGRVTFDKQKWGDRTFDFNADGVAQYGLYADWLASRTPAEQDRLFGERGAEAYLEMWERAWNHGG